MARVRTVVFVNHTAQMGGAEFALLRLVRAIDRRKWHPVIVFGEEGAAAQCAQREGLECYVLPLSKALGATRKEALRGVGLCEPKRWAGAARWGMDLLRFFRERGADIVHTNSMKAHVLGGLAARTARLPVVWHLRDTIAPCYLPQSAVTAMRRMIQWVPDALVSVSRSVACSALGAQKQSEAWVIYDGLEASAFSDHKATSEHARDGVWTVGMVGRLTRWKGQHVFLEAASILRDQGYPVRFEILGDTLFGEQKYAEALRKQVLALGLEEIVFFRGFTKDVIARMQTWEVSVHASLTPDPCPNVVIEAMAAGVPVVGSHGGGVPELLDGGHCGRLFPSGDARALAQVLAQLLINAKERQAMAQRARARAEMLFRSERVAQEVESVWDRVASERTWRQRKWRWIEEGMALSGRSVFCDVRDGKEANRIPNSGDVSEAPHASTQKAGSRVLTDGA